MGQTREKKPSKRSLKAQNTWTTIGKIATPDIPTSEAGARCSTATSWSLPLVKSGLISDLSSSPSSTSQRSSDIALPAKSVGPPPYDQSLVTVRNTPGRGYGLFTTRRIREGTLVLAEVPIFRFTAEEEAADCEFETVLRKKYDGLSEPSRKSYLKLHNANKSGFSRLKSIYFSNCYNLESPRSVLGGSCIGLLMSRVNHSCLPNVQFSFEEDLPDDFSMSPPQDYAEHDVVATDAEACSYNRNQGIMLFHTIKDIPAGKEVMSNYESAYLLASDRQLKQQMHYGFSCDCQACNGSQSDIKHWALSDSRRHEMILCKKQIDRAEAAWRSCKHLHQECNCSHRRSISMTIATLERLAALLAKEGLKGVELANVYKDLAEWSLRGGDLCASEEWCRSERNTCMTIYGSWSLRVIEVNKKLDVLNKM